MLMVMQNQTEMNKKERNKKGAVERERESKPDQEVVVVEVKALTEKRTLYSSSSSC